MGKFKVKEMSPSVDDYNRLRESVGWHTVSEQRAGLALGNSLYCVCAVDDDHVLGMGRVVGDGGIYFYLQDVLVAPEFQRRGLGRSIMNRLMAFIDAQAPMRSGALVALMTAPGIGDFYRQYGFKIVPSVSPFMYSWRNGH